MLKITKERSHILVLRIWLCFAVKMLKQKSIRRRKRSFHGKRLIKVHKEKNLSVVEEHASGVENELFAEEVEENPPEEVDEVARPFSIENMSNVSA